MKVALIFHGWPQAVGDDHSLVKLLRKKNYDVVKPYLLDWEVKINRDNVRRAVTEAVGNREVELIVAMSMGGFVAGWIVEEYPKAKIVLVATAARFGAKVKMFKLLIYAIAWGFWGMLLVRTLLGLAPKFMKWWYKLLTNGGKHGRYLQKDIDKSVGEILRIEPQRHLEVVKMIARSDHRRVWSKIGNKTLILSGGEDMLMPVDKGEELHRLIKNSQIVITKASHYNVLNRETYTQINKFLSSKF